MNSSPNSPNFHGDNEERRRRNASRRRRRYNPLQRSNNAYPVQRNEFPNIPQHMQTHENPPYIPRNDLHQKPQNVTKIDAIRNEVHQSSPKHDLHVGNNSPGPSTTLIEHSGSVSQPTTTPITTTTTTVGTTKPIIRLIFFVMPKYF